MIRDMRIVVIIRGLIGRTTHPHHKFSLLVGVLITLAAPALHSQVTAATAATLAQPTSAAPAPIKPIPFEVVSIRPSVPTHIHGDYFTDDGYTIRGITPYTLLTYMSKTLSGVPDWCSNERYDIEAKVAEADVPAWKSMNFKQKSLSMQSMLENRFHLKWHMETKMEPGFELVIAKNGSKLKEAKPDETYADGVKAEDGTPLKGVFLSSSSRRGSGLTGFIGQAARMDQLTYYLQMFARAPVIDKTGLGGTYDLTLVAAHEPSPTATDSDLINDGPSLFSAVQQQLGLKLTPAKVPVEYLVVDHIEVPSEN
jgi:uncharacterized protein (TIGR03435 family)